MLQGLKLHSKRHLKDRHNSTSAYPGRQLLNNNFIFLVSHARNMSLSLKKRKNSTKRPLVNKLTSLRFKSYFIFLIFFAHKGNNNQVLIFSNFMVIFYVLALDKRSSVNTITHDFQLFTHFFVILHY